MPGCDESIMHMLYGVQAMLCSVRTMLVALGVQDRQLVVHVVYVLVPRV